MIIEFLNNFLAIGGQYVSWKNNHEIDLVLSGESDLDIFIPHVYKKSFFELAKKENWIIVKNPVADYPNVCHFFSIDKELKVYHLHVYFKVITGESWLKEYNFPLDDFLIENRTLHPSGIYILNKKAQAYLFVLRHFLKGYSLSSRILYKNELSSYKEEWEACKLDFNPGVYPNLIDFTEYMKSSGLKNGFNLPVKKIAKAVRTKLKPYLRLPYSRLFWYRLRSFKKRLFNKLFLKEKKILPKNGFVLAFSGADGVGKSTMSESIRDTYKVFMTTKWVELGKPQSKGIEQIRKIINKPGSSSSGQKNTSSKSSHKVGIKKSFSAVFLAYLRYKTSKQVEKYRKKGYLVISDRWPTEEYFKMDGPKLKVEEQTGVSKQMALIEQKYYGKIIDSDLTLILTVPVEVAIKRNRERIKTDKETDEEIKQRHRENAEHQPKARKIIRFDNNGELKEKRLEILHQIQQELFQEID